MFGKALIVTILVTLLVISITVLAADDDTATVQVTIQALSRITVSPKTLYWTVQPGQSGNAQILDITNTGSLNVSNVYAYVDTLEDETARPYGSTNATNYAAGGVIIFKNETYDKYFFAGRLEWNWTENISGMNQGGVSSPVAWGFFRNTTYEYNWLLGNGTNGYCNNTGAQFAIEDDVDNGTTTTRQPTTTDISYDEGDENYGYFVTTSYNRIPINESCIAVSSDCTKIYVYKYDKRSDFGSCDNSTYVQEPILRPWEVHTLTMNVYVPIGVPNGTMNTSTFTVYAT